MGIFSDKPVTGTVRDAKSIIFDKRPSNGNTLDTDNPDGARHAAALGPHRAAVNDLRPASDRAGKHRAS